MCSYFGCGVMAGMDLKPDDKEGTLDTFELCVEQGMAVDCHGFPLELCRPIKLNLAPSLTPCAGNVIDLVKMKTIFSSFSIWMMVGVDGAGGSIHMMVGLTRHCKCHCSPG